MESVCCDSIRFSLLLIWEGNFSSVGECFLSILVNALVRVTARRRKMYDCLDFISLAKFSDKGKLITMINMELLDYLVSRC